MSSELTVKLKKIITGVGVGLRSCHYDYILQHQPAIEWFEVLTDNYLLQSGYDFKCLNEISSIYPVTLHGVGMSLGSTDPLNQEYLFQLKQLVKRIQPQYISDHLSWSSVNNQYFHDLLPLPFTEESIKHVVSRIQKVQDYLGCQILIENVSSYFQYKANEMNEWDFINEIVKRSDCFVLLDVNNIFVSSQNQNFDPQDFISGLIPERVKQFHIAGHEDKEKYLFDTHDRKVSTSVWNLYRDALECFGCLPTCLEWDSNIPIFRVLQSEAQKAQTLIKEVEQENAIA